MKSERFWVSLINVMFCFINVILWIFNTDPLGQIFFNTYYPTKKVQQLVFGLLTLLMYLTVIPFFVNIYFWWMKQESLPTQLTKKIFTTK